VPRTERSLSLQARLIAVVCLLVDLVVFATLSPDLPVLPRVLVLAAIVCVDGALALPTRYSGWVVLAQAAAAVGLAVVLRGTPAADHDLVGGLIAAYRAGAWLGGWRAIAVLAIAAAGAGASQALLVPLAPLTVAVEGVRDALVPWMVGRYTSARRAYISELRHRRESELRDAATAVEKAVATERTSIARDLHDVISHHVSAVGVHAGAARMILSAKPGFADPEITESLAAVEMSSRSAMSDLRRLLDILHGAPDPATQPGVDGIDDLVAGVRRSGLPIRFEVRGSPREPPGSAGIALYRIAQEMLTNALRHGDSSTVELSLEFGETAVVLCARNGITKSPAPGGSTGRGLTGIRSRAALFGGAVTHGPASGGDVWETTVTVPDRARTPGGPE
jgi:signal transduction histidine kinase